VRKNSGPSDVDLGKSEFEDWKSIPSAAWEDAKQKRIRNNKVLAESWPSQTVKVAGKDYRLFTHCYNGRGKNRHYSLTLIDAGFETVAWASLSSYVESGQIILEDLFVKPEFRRSHHGTRLLHRIEQICCLEEPFSQMKHEILVPISIPDAGPTRYNVTRDFFITNGYVWKTTEPIRRYAFTWSTFTAVKALDCAAIHNDYALELYNEKEISKAEGQFIAALQIGPKNAAIHANYAILLLKLKRYTDSETQLQQSLSLDEERPETHSVYANLLRELGRNEDAERHYLRGLELKEAFPQLHTNYAVLLRRMGRLVDAETHFKRALEIEESPETHFGYALLLEDLKRGEEVEIHYKRALELRPVFPEASRGYAKLLTFIHRYAEAEQYYQQALEVKDKDAEAHAGYGFLLAILKRFDESEEQYSKAIELKEANAEWIDAACLYGEFGGLCEDRGQLNQAEASYEKALEISTRIGQSRLRLLASNDLSRVRDSLEKTR
jgi:Tfp pilus assembly protein PilF